MNPHDGVCVGQGGDFDIKVRLTSMQTCSIRPEHSGKIASIRLYCCRSAFCLSSQRLHTSSREWEIAHLRFKCRQPRRFAAFSGNATWPRNEFRAVFLISVPASELLFRPLDEVDLRRRLGTRKPLALPAHLC
jgi:hypothetical protein